MRILHFITSLRTGGAEHLMVDLLPLLRDMGHHVELLLLDGTRTPFYERLERKGIVIRALGQGAKAMHDPLQLFRLRRYLSRHRYDIVHTHNTPCQLLMAMTSGSFRHVTVTTEHNTSNRRRAWRWYRSVDRAMYSRYSRVICVNEETADALADALGSVSLSGRVCVVHNGIDVGKYINAVPDSDLQERYAGERVIVMIAAFRRQKDQPTLIRAMRLLPDGYRLLLAGDGECRRECEALARECGVESKVDFLGIRADVASLLKVADVVVMSSHYEGLSLSSLEGMASGKPFIASDVDGLHDIVGGAGLLFPRGDCHRLAGLIRQVCEDSAFGRMVADRCMERVMRYDVARMAAGYMRVYETVLKEKR